MSDTTTDISSDETTTKYPIITKDTATFEPFDVNGTTYSVITLRRPNWSELRQYPGAFEEMGSVEYWNAMANLVKVCGSVKKTSDIDAFPAFVVLTMCNMMGLLLMP